MTNKPATSNVSVSKWKACYNSGDGVIALTCVVSSSGPDISGVGLMLNTSEGEILISSYFEFSDSETVTPALNLPMGNLKVGDSVNAVASGQSNGQHFFFEESLTIVDC